MTTIIGWDIGGVHVKVAVVTDGQVTAVEQIPCTLWLGVSHLRETLKAASARYPGADRHAITMTGELAESFPSREDGVKSICAEACAVLGEDNTRFYVAAAGADVRRFYSRNVVDGMWGRVASANWHASAAWAAAKRPDALFIDIGSTTTDIILLRNGGVAAEGCDDGRRLETGELLYTGVTRTSLMVMGGAPFGGTKQTLMAENFSTTADIYRLSGELDALDDTYPASDGRGKSAAECRARLARMFGRDARDAPDERWDFLARYFRERHLQMLSEAVAQVLSRGIGTDTVPFIAAGAGHFLVQELARRFGRTCETFASLVPAADEAVGARAAVCAPAVAVALLAAAEG